MSHFLVLCQHLGTLLGTVVLTGLGTVLGTVVGTVVGTVRSCCWRISDTVAHET